MTWSPTSKFEQAADRLIATARDNAAVWARDEQARVAEKLAARGLGQSGAMVSAKQSILGEAFKRTGDAAIHDVLLLTTEVYGQIPAEAVPWIRTKLSELIDAQSGGYQRQAEELFRRANIDPRASGEPIRFIAAGLKRDLEAKLAPIELRAELAQLTPPAHRDQLEGAEADVFVCHASEDKDAVAMPLAQRLKELGYEVWIDKVSLKLGDRLLDKIDDGIASTRFGVVILSKRFFEKNWTRRELSGLAAREDAEERPMILPVRVDIDQKELAKQSPLLAAILGADWSEGLDAVVAKIIDVIGPPMKVKT